MPDGAENLVSALALHLGGLRNAHVAVETIRRNIDAHPDWLEELFPGMKLAPRKRTRKEAAEIMRLAGQESLERIVERRYKKLVPVIQDLIDKDPMISLAQIAGELNLMGIKPVRSDKWSRSSVRFVMNKAGIERGSE